MKRPFIRSLVTWLIVAGLAAFAVYKIKFAPIPTVAHVVARGEIVAEVMGTGTLEARVKTTVSARIQERLAEVLVDQGDSVKAGQLLARLDDPESRQQVAIAEAERQIVVAEKNLLFRKEQLAFTEIHAPYDGLIIRRDRDPGDMLVPGASLIQVISLGELWVSAWVDETAMPALAANQPARVVFRSEPGRSYPGKVSRLGREMDRETREFLVDVRATELPKNWIVGQRAEVFIETGRQADAVLLPPAFLVWKGAKAGVFVNADAKAQWREVTLGLRGRDHVAITQGLSVGDQVVRPPDGQKAALTEGQRIALQP